MPQLAEPVLDEWELAEQLDHEDKLDVFHPDQGSFLIMESQLNNDMAIFEDIKARMEERYMKLFTVYWSSQGILIDWMPNPDYMHYR